MTSNYAQQAALVIKAIPIIAKEDIFALKGGTAPHLAELPAIIWTRKNLETLRQANPAKFAEQRKLLGTALD